MRAWNRKHGKPSLKHVVSVGFRLADAGGGLDTIGVLWIEAAAANNIAAIGNWVVDDGVDWGCIMRYSCHEYFYFDCLQK